MGEARREESWVPSSPELQMVRGKQIILPDILTTESDSEAESDMEADPALDNKETDRRHSKQLFCGCLFLLIKLNIILLLVKTHCC